MSRRTGALPVNNASNKSYLLSSIMHCMEWMLSQTCATVGVLGKCVGGVTSSSETPWIATVEEAIANDTSAPLPTLSTTQDATDRVLTSSPPPTTTLPDNRPSIGSSAEVTSLAELALPRTPSKRSRTDVPESNSVVPSSEYYTAAWGSPYELSPSTDLRSINTALSEQLRSDDYLSSPDTPFGLEHLIPSRFGSLALPEPEQDFEPTTPNPGAFEHTPRPPVERWVSLPKREAPEKPQWWSESSSGSDRERRSSSGQGTKRTRGHKKRRENRTLDQQAYLELVRGHQDGDMSGLAASRWASTPVQEVEKKVELPPAEEKVAEQNIVTEEESPQVEAKAEEPVASEEKSVAQQEEDIVQAVIEKSDAAAVDSASAKSTSAPTKAEDAPLSWAEDVEESIAAPTTGSTTIRLPAETSATTQADVLATPTIELPPQVDEPQAKAEDIPETPTVAQPFRLQPPRLKKRISWNGKNCMINIPSHDFIALGLQFPMTLEEAQERIASFSPIEPAEGQSSNGNDAAHVRPIWPDERETRSWKLGQSAKVSLPDLNALRDAEQALVEAKLAALGVGLSDEAPSPQPADMSRQGSFVFPQTFSPPIPTASANGMRPAFVRGHSHTMSVASPITVGNGPFGHMHRHSTFHGFSPLQTQELNRQAALSGSSGFSPTSPFNMPSIPQIASPAQLTMLRNDYGLMRGPGSPLSQSITPDINDLQRQKLQSLMQQPPLPPLQPLQRGAFEQIGALPELPEDEDEDELSDPTPYVPPHKRSQVNEEIVVPTPRHRHNISENLERGLLEIEQREEQLASPVKNNSFGQAPRLFGQVSDQVPAEKDPLSGDYHVQESGHNHKRSGSRFVAPAASAFTFNPAANFNPGASFSFGAAPAVKKASINKHTRQVSSGNFNAAAPEFTPSSSLNGPAPPSSEFSFSTQGPSFNTDVPAFVPQAAPEKTIVDQLPSIFGKINIPDIVKPSKKSKAVAIVRPGDVSGVSASATEAEDSEGRIARADERLKRTRKFGGDSGDEVPQFAVPSPAPALPEVPVLPSQPTTSFPVVDDSSARPSDAEGSTAPVAPRQTSISFIARGHKANNSSLSALAQPWQPSKSLPAQPKLSQDEEEVAIKQEAAYSPPVSEPGEIEEDNAELDAIREPATGATVYPSFDEIDAVMQQLNAGDEPVADPEKNDQFAPQEGVQYLSTWPRSDAPSPSPKRQYSPYKPSPPVGDNAARNFAINGDPWSGVNRLNKAPGPPSDWSDMLPPADDEKLQTRSAFFDNRVDDVVGRVLAERLRPFEDALQNIQLALRKTSPIHRRSSKHRSSSAIESDADDEDDSDRPRQRPISRGRDDKLVHIKAMVLEALREQSPRREQSSYDIAELHSALADMKMSFARAASSSLELDDIRAVVEDVVAHQPAPAPVMPTEDPDTASHKKQLTELEGKLNETLTNALEQANRMHEVEQREAEARRMWKLAEEELKLLREDNDDGENRSRAFESERVTLLERVDEAKEAQAKAEDHSDNLRAEVEALQATLEEYRISSKQWRQTAEEHKVERESLQGTVQTLERQLQDTQESGSGIKRRLEKLHADMATASGQLTSEKNRWKTREETMRAQCESLEAQLASTSREKVQLEEEVRTLSTRNVGLDEVKSAFEGLQTSNTSLSDVVQSLRGELQASQALAAQFEHDFKEATEAGRAEVQRVRLAMELDVEAANHRASLMRAELEGEVTKVRAELDSVKLEADTAKEKHALMLDEQAEVRDSHLQAISTKSQAAIDEARTKYETTIRDLTQQHGRSLAHAVEDKERSEYILNERLSLADAKLQHFQDRIVHLEERVQIAKTAAQAAAMSAQTSKSAPVPAYRSAPVPEKVSPQALRESILVLQEQLQDRELRIERLQQKLKTDGPAKIKEKDTEIAWLRELLTVRGEELNDLVGALSKPDFDRDAVRDAAIRIQANLQMEQQEKQRTSGSMTAGQAIASLSSFATPKAAQLTSAFNKWRTSMESTALKTRSASGSARGSATPSRAPSVAKGSYGPSGLMTPPTSNLRSSPSPETTRTVPAPKLSARRESKAKQIEEVAPEPEEAPSTPNLFGSGHYDDDAEDRVGEMPNLDDDDLDIADSQPPAFRSLEDELNEPVEAGAEE